MGACPSPRAPPARPSPPFPGVGLQSLWGEHARKHNLGPQPGPAVVWAEAGTGSPVAGIDSGEASAASSQGQTVTYLAACPRGPGPCAFFAVQIKASCFAPVTCVRHIFSCHMLVSSLHHSVLVQSPTLRPQSLGVLQLGWLSWVEGE